MLYVEKKQKKHEIKCSRVKRRITSITQSKGNQKNKEWDKRKTHRN